MDLVTTLQAPEILAVQEARAHELFSGDDAEIRRQFRRWAHRWHPDHNPDPRAHEVFVHLRQLYERVRGPRPKTLGEVHFTAQDGRVFRFTPRASAPFELGTFHRGQASVAYHVRPEHRPLFDQAVHAMGHQAFKDAKMKAQMEPQLPRLHTALWGPEGGLLVVRRDPQAVRLRDLLEHLATKGQTLDPRHVGWLLNSLYNLACYFHVTHQAHQALTSDNVWVVPEKHLVQVLGGWFYTAPWDKRITALPAASVAVAPRAYLDARVAGPRLDLEAIAALGREALGDRAGMGLMSRTDVPRSMTDALRLPATGSALERYQGWKQTLIDCFGPPKFVPLTVTSNLVYKENHHG